ncbi:MAG TPA: hypothetical protein VMM36_09605 [Opitutaceae bacterium]|nr:hypothetical protein [Opitutaceae bacterium]
MKNLKTSSAGAHNWLTGPGTSKKLGLLCFCFSLPSVLVLYLNAYGIISRSICGPLGLSVGLLNNSASQVADAAGQVSSSSQNRALRRRSALSAPNRRLRLQSSRRRTRRVTGP